MNQLLTVAQAQFVRATAVLTREEAGELVTDLMQFIYSPMDGRQLLSQPTLHDRR